MEYVDIDPDSIGNENDTEATLNACIDSTREPVSDADIHCECDKDRICEYCLDTYCLV